MNTTLILISSTIPHLGALFFFPHPPYQATVAVSTLASIAWYASGDPILSPLGLLNYSAAAAWFLADCIYSYETPGFLLIFMANLASAILNTPLTQIHAVYGHSAWHILNALKSFWVAHLLSQLASG